MNIVNLVVTLLIVGVGLWAINTYVPMDRKIKSILNVIVVILVILWLPARVRHDGRIGSMRVGG